MYSGRVNFLAKDLHSVFLTSRYLQLIDIESFCHEIWSNTTDYTCYLQPNTNITTIYLDDEQRKNTHSDRLRPVLFVNSLVRLSDTPSANNNSSQPTVTHSTATTYHDTTTLLNYINDGYALSMIDPMNVFDPFLYKSNLAPCIPHPWCGFIPSAYIRCLQTTFDSRDTLNQPPTYIPADSNSCLKTDSNQSQPKLRFINNCIAYQTSLQQKQQKGIYN